MVSRESDLPLLILLRVLVILAIVVVPTELVAHDRMSQSVMVIVQGVVSGSGQWWA